MITDSRICLRLFQFTAALLLVVGSASATSWSEFSTPLLYYPSSVVYSSGNKDTSYTILGSPINGTFLPLVGVKVNTTSMNFQIPAYNSTDAGALSWQANNSPGVAVVGPNNFVYLLNSNNNQNSMILHKYNPAVLGDLSCASGVCLSSNEEPTLVASFPLGSNFDKVDIAFGISNQAAILFSFEYDIAISSSSDNGETWSNLFLVNAAQGTPGRDYPTRIAYCGGRYHVLYTSTDTQASYSKLFHVKTTGTSPAEGQWEAPVEVELVDPSADAPFFVSQLLCLHDAVLAIAGHSGLDSGDFSALDLHLFNGTAWSKSAIIPYDSQSPIGYRAPVSLQLLGGKYLILSYRAGVAGSGVFKYNWMRCNLTQNYSFSWSSPSHITADSTASVEADTDPYASDQTPMTCGVESCILPMSVSAAEVGTYSGRVAFLKPCGNGQWEADWGEQCDSTAQCSPTCVCNSGYTTSGNGTCVASPVQSPVIAGAPTASPTGLPSPVAAPSAPTIRIYLSGSVAPSNDVINATCVGVYTALNLTSTDVSCSSNQVNKRAVAATYAVVVSFTTANGETAASSFHSSSAVAASVLASVTSQIQAVAGNAYTVSLTILSPIFSPVGQSSTTTPTSSGATMPVVSSASADAVVLPAGAIAGIVVACVLAAIIIGVVVYVTIAKTPGTGASVNSRTAPASPRTVTMASSSPRTPRGPAEEESSSSSSSFSDEDGETSDDESDSSDGDKEKESKSSKDATDGSEEQEEEEEQEDEDEKSKKSSSSSTSDESS